MMKMGSHLENIISAYKTLSKIPSVTGGKLNNSATKVTGRWSVRNLDKGKNTKYVTTYTLDESLKVVGESDFGSDVSNELLSAVSPSETFKAIIREEKNAKDVKKQYLEVWNKSTLAHSIDLTALDIHGDVYADSEFGSLDWAHDETAVVYIAEKKLAKSEPYIKRKGEEKPKTDGSGETAPKKGEEFLYRQDWGEQLVGKHLSVIVVCKLPSETCTVLEGLPESWCPGQVRFSPGGDSVVGVAWETEPRRLGLIFCTNRPSYIFNLTLDGTMRKLSNEGLAVRSPRFSPTGDLVWLQRQAGGPHHACHQLVMLKNGSNAPTTVVDIVENKIKTATDEDFFGLYCLGLPSKCFSQDGKRILLSTPQQTEVRSYVIDIDGGRIVDISNNNGSTTLLDVRGDTVLAACSSMTSPGRGLNCPSVNQWNTALKCNSALRCLLFARGYTAPLARMSFIAQNHKPLWPIFHRDAMAAQPVAATNKMYTLVAQPNGLQLFVAKLPSDKEWQIEWVAVSAAVAVPESVASARVEYQFLSQQDTSEKVTSFNAIYFGPDVLDKKGMPLIVWPHGGPHSNFVNAFSLEAALFNMLGFACLQVNYRGSSGTGQASIQYLPKRVGDADVKDCVLAANVILAKYPIDAKKLCLFGGSHGGFLVTHLSGQYPDMFAVVVSRNPVTDVATMFNSTDIADCRGYYVCGYYKGFASIRINYRGSIGLGDANVRSLLSHVGNYDVRDCYLALTNMLERDGSMRPCLYGGSYGGLIVGHLAAMYPDLFKAMVMRNPLIDLATKGNYADNSDGCAVEAGYVFSERGPVSEDELLSMRRCSPLVHVHNVRAPTALMLGSVDKRVPHYQGLEYARRLRANGVPTRIYMYDDNHSLSSTPAEMDNLINSANWFLEHLPTV